MNIAQYALNNRVVMYMVTVVVIGGGILSYQSMSRLEDPEFAIKEALIVTQYPGASPQEVEQEVTDKIETAVQALGQTKLVTSMSKAGLSTITVEVKDKYDKKTLPQVWDELRRKVRDVQGNLPPGAGTPKVYDDYGDVYGVFFALTGEGYSHQELYRAAKNLKRELLLAQDVARVEIFGNQQETVYVEMSRAKMTELGISQDQIYQTLSNQNVVVPSGEVTIGTEDIRISPTGIQNSVEEIGNLLIRSSAQPSTGYPEQDKLLYLKDVAQIKRGYLDPPVVLMSHNGLPALGIGISTVAGGNVVTMGKAVMDKLAHLETTLPLGMKLSPIYYQPERVTEAVNGFAISLLEALVIVVAVLMLFMGIRSGVLVGSILLLTICGTMIVIRFWDISLERISLGALIIALGMLVDNAIVVTDGMLVGIQSGMNRRDAALHIVSRSAWPLLGATTVAILAFAGIGLSQNVTGEFCYSLFQVILISLFLSWVFAVTLTPVFGEQFLKVKKEGTTQDPYTGVLYRMYRYSLTLCLEHKWLTAASLVILLCVSLYAFGFTKESFFPDSNLKKFYINYWAPEGTDIRKTANDVKKIAEWLKDNDKVESVTTSVGQGVLRFMLTYGPEKTNGSYGFILVGLKEFKDLDELIPQVTTYVTENFPGAEPVVNRFVLGPGGEFKIQARFRGPDPKVLRELSNRAQAIMREDPGIKNVTDDWRRKVKVVVPEFSESKARRAGVSRSDLANALEMTFSGRSVGLWREGDELLPIISRPQENERTSVENIHNVYVWSATNAAPIPIRQVLSGFRTEWEDPIIRRRNRVPTIHAQCDPKTETASAVLERIRPKIEAIALPQGYEMEWGGEYEDSRDAQVALGQMLPLSFLAMIMVIVIMFNAIRQPLVILLTIPFAIIGVTVGLLVTGQSLTFVALLGLISLSGMLIKNGVILVDQIDYEKAEGTEPFPAIVEASVSRMRPVAMAAITTILGMIPLITDPFFVSMAVTIMFGLAFATALTLMVVPVFYAIFFRVDCRNTISHGNTTVSHSNE
jgi:multidrug efflux pump subunit AcrB